MTTRNAWANLIRWFGGPRRRSVARRQDFADHGTAFGLDLSLAPDVIANANPNLNPAQAALLAKPAKAAKVGRSGASTA